MNQLLLNFQAHYAYQTDKFILTKADSIDVEVKDVLVSSTNPFAIEVFSSFGRGDVVELKMLPGAVEGAGRQFSQTRFLISGLRLS